MKLTQEQIDAIGPPEELSRLFARGNSPSELFDRDAAPTLWASQLVETERPPLTQEQIDSCGTREQLLRMFELGRRATVFFQCHEQEFAALYPNEWVAVTENALIAHAAEFEEVDALIAGRGLPPGAVFSWFLRDSESPLIL
ncbi:MAG: hypothetical protein ACRDG3_03655 [Tepidiformaceae bacterium]